WPPVRLGRHTRCKTAHLREPPRHIWRSVWSWLLFASLELIHILLLIPERRHTIERALVIGDTRIDPAERPAAGLAGELCAEAVRPTAREQRAVPRRRDHRPGPPLAQGCGAFGEGTRQVEVRHILAVQQHQRGVVEILGRA